MSLWTKINRMNAGKWSPLLDGRTDLEGYDAALKTCTGFWPLKYGPAERIRGFEYACDAKTADVRLIPFRFDQSTNYVIESDGTYMRLFDSSQASAQDSCVTVDVANVSDWAIGTTYRYGELVRYGNTDATGTISSSGTAITGVGTAFTTEFEVGDYIQEKGSDQIAKITVITDNTNMTVDTTFSPAASGDGFAEVKLWAFDTLGGGTDSAVASTGTISSSGTAITGVGTSFTTEYAVGDFIREDGNNQVARVTVITDNTNMTVDSTFSPAASGDTFANVSFDSSGWHALTQTATAGTYIYEIPLHLSAWQSTFDKPHIAQVNDVMYMANESYAPFKLSRYGATDWRVEEIDYSYPPTVSQNTSTTTLTPTLFTGSTTMTASADTFESGHVGTKWEWRTDRDAEHASFDLTTGGASDSGTIPVFGDWTFTTTGTNWTDTIYLERSIDGPAGTFEKVYEVQATGSSQENFSITGNENDPRALYRIRKGANSTNGVAHLAVGQTEVRGVFEITSYSSATSVGITWTKEPQYAGTPGASTKWSEGAFSSVQGWPATCCFYQGRLWFGGTSNRKQTIWGSEIDDFENFGTSIPNVLASDSVSYTISSVEQNKIRWMLPLNDLIIGTTGTEHSVRGADNNAIEATQAPLIQQESAVGSYYNQPNLTKDGIVFSNQDASKVYAIDYDWRTRGYVTEDLTRLNESQVSAKFRSYVKDPYSIFYCGAGASIFGCVFNKKEDVIAWFDRDAPVAANTLAACSFKDLTSTYGTTEDDLWVNFAIQNEPGGTGKTNVICRLGRESSSRDIPPYLDAYETANGSTSTNLTTPDPDLGATYTQVTGIDRFGFFNALTGTVTINGTTAVVGSGTAFSTELEAGDYIRVNSEVRRVASIADNTNLTTSSAFAGSSSGLSIEEATGRDDLYAVFNGIVYGPFQVRGDRFSIEEVIDAANEDIIYGLPYTSEIQTTKLQAPAGDGMSRSKTKRAINVGLGMKDTLGGEIGIKWEFQDGQTGEDTYEIPFRTPQDEMDTAVPFFTGEKLMPLPHGNYRYFSLYYKQTKPLPATITYMSPQILPKGQ